MPREGQNVAGDSIGIELLTRAVLHAQELGITKITAIGGSGSGMTGYRTWPSLGFDFKMEAGKFRNTYGRGIPKSEEMIRLGTRGGEFSLHKLLESREGRDLWRDHGEAIPLEFDLKPRSASIEKLAETTRKLKSRVVREGAGG